MNDEQKISTKWWNAQHFRVSPPIHDMPVLVSWNNMSWTWAIFFFLDIFYALLYWYLQVTCRGSTTSWTSSALCTTSWAPEPGPGPTGRRSTSSTMSAGAEQYSTVQWSTAHSTVQYSTVQYSTAQYTVQSFHSLLLLVNTDTREYIFRVLGTTRERGFYTDMEDLKVETNLIYHMFWCFDVFVLFQNIIFTKFSDTVACVGNPKLKVEDGAVQVEIQNLNF